MNRISKRAFLALLLAVPAANGRCHFCAKYEKNGNHWC